MLGLQHQANFYLKKDDLLPALQVILYDAHGPLDLTAATVTFRMRQMGSTGSPKISATATIVNAVDGVVRYDWVTGDTDTPGYYDVEWRVVMFGGKQITFPNNGNIRILITANLAS